MTTPLAPDLADASVAATSRRKDCLWHGVDAPWWIAWAAMAICFALLLWLVPRQFSTGDDLGVASFLQADVDCPFVSPLFSDALGYCYSSLAEEFPWYGVALYLVLFLSLAIAGHELLTAALNLRSVTLAICMAAAAATGAIFVLKLTFTMVAILASGVALLTFAAFELRRLRGLASPHPLAYLGCGLLLAAGYAIRPKGCQAAAVFCLPLAIASFAWWWRSAAGASLGSAVRHAIVFSIPLLLFIGIQALVRQEEQSWSQYNETRGWLHGFPPYAQLYERAPQRVLEAGWTLEDARAFDGFLFFYDEQRFSLAKLESLRDAGVSPETSWRETAARLRSGWSNGGAAAWLFLATLAVALLAAWAQPETRAALLFAILLFCLVFAGTTWAMLHFLRFPERVAMPGFFLGSLGLLYAIAHRLAELTPVRSTPPLTSRVLGRLAPLASYVLFAGSLALLAQAYYGHLPTISRQAQRQQSAEIRQFAAASHIRSVLVMPTCTRCIFDTDPLSSEPVPRELNPIWTGWLTYSPLFYRGLQWISGVDNGAQLLPRMCGRSDCGLLAYEYQLSYIEEIYRRVYDQSVRFEKEAATSSGAAFYSIHLSHEPRSRTAAAPRAAAF